MRADRTYIRRTRTDFIVDCVTEVSFGAFLFLLAYAGLAVLLRW